MLVKLLVLCGRRAQKVGESGKVDSDKRRPTFRLLRFVTNPLLLDLPGAVRDKLRTKLPVDRDRTHGAARFFNLPYRQEWIVFRFEDERFNVRSSCQPVLILLVEMIAFIGWCAYE